MNNIRTPNAAVKIYNYANRFGSFSKIYQKESDNTTAIDEIIVNSDNLISVSTNKSKSSPAGSFEFRLAPTHNWIEMIVPGSWCIIYMSNGQDLETGEFDSSVSRRNIKMVGRIDSVRQVSGVSQDGTISTNIVVTGLDWGSIFQSYIYVDPLFRAGRLDDTMFGHSAAFKTSVYKKESDPKKPNTAHIHKLNSTTAIASILNFWSDGLDQNAEKLETAYQEKSGRALNTRSSTNFKIPEPLAKYLGFKKYKQEVDPETGVTTTTEIDEVATRIVDIVDLVSGKLEDLDKYSGFRGVDSVSDGTGIISPSSVIGGHTMWQILLDNCNDAINELFCEMRFTGDMPRFTLYKRIKPFVINNEIHLLKDTYQVGDNIKMSEGVESLLNNYVSYFNKVKYKLIPIEEILSVSVGTNWRDKYNHINVHIDLQRLNLQGMSSFMNQFHKDSQIFDRNSIVREGCLPMTMSLKYVPFIIKSQGTSKESTDKQNNMIVDTIKAFKALGKEWYFDTHMMLNGGLNMIGSSSYIEVGQNILIPMRAISPSYNLNLSTTKAKEESYLLAHVESVSNNASVNQSGARSFTTTVQFVRGIVVNRSLERIELIDDNSDLIDEVAYGGKEGAMTLDPLSTEIKYEESRNKNVILTRSNRSSPLKSDKEEARREGDIGG